MRRILFLILTLTACSQIPMGRGPIPSSVPALPSCRIQWRSGQLFDTTLHTPCEVGMLNGTVRCLPVGMWEERGAAWATPQCDRLFEWAANDSTPCLDGKSGFAIVTTPRAGLPQTCGDLVGVIYQISPTDLVVQYDKAHGCSPFPFVLDLSTSRYSDYVPYPPAALTEADFVDPAAQSDCSQE